MTLTNKTVAIVQSNYIPWKGYFDMINMVDEFILFDEVQYTRRDWRNRNIIKTAAGPKWITIPVQAKNNFYTPINQIVTANNSWRIDHWQLLQQHYRKAPFFSWCADAIEPLYRNSDETVLSKINYMFIQAICNLLGITTEIAWSDHYKSEGIKSAKLAAICNSAGATCYVSGPAAKVYLDEQIFEKAGIEVSWMDYSEYPLYHQAHEPFVHGVSILDLLFNQGPDSIHFMKSFSQ